MRRNALAGLLALAALFWAAPRAATAWDPAGGSPAFPIIAPPPPAPETRPEPPPDDDDREIVLRTARVTKPNSSHTFSAWLNCPVLELGVTPIRRRSDSFRTMHPWTPTRTLPPPRAPPVR